MVDPVLVSRQKALWDAQQVVADNVAQSGSNGFQEQLFYSTAETIKQDYSRIVSIPFDYGTYRNLEPGAPKGTYNPLNAMIIGKGYFAIQKGEQEMYSRDGQFTIGVNGDLVTPLGHPVLGAGGSTITIPSNASYVQILPNGEIDTNLGIIGKLKIVEFDKPQQMAYVGDNLLKTTEQPIEVQEVNLMPEYIESSNSDGIRNMASMMSIMREFEVNQNTIKQENTAVEELIKYII